MGSSFWYTVYMKLKRWYLNTSRPVWPCCQLFLSGPRMILFTTVVIHCAHVSWLTWRQSVDMHCNNLLSFNCLSCLTCYMLLQSTSVDLNRNFRRCPSDCIKDIWCLMGFRLNGLLPCYSLFTAWLKPSPFLPVFSGYLWKHVIW